MSHPINVFTADAGRRIVDAVNPLTGLGHWSRMSQKDLEAKYGAIRVRTLDEAAKEMDGANVSEPIPVTEQQYTDALECLPPLVRNSDRDTDTESFQMSEYYSGNITSIYVRVGSTYWCFRDYAHSPHQKLVDKVSSATR